MAKAETEQVLSIDKIKKYHASICAAKRESDDARDEVSAVSKEAKEAGINVKVMKLCIRLQKLDPVECKAFISTFETYCAALGLDAQQDMFEDAKNKKAA